MLDLNLLRVFAAVVETGSVTAAAARLNLSQPSVTHAINRLRDVTGDRLFQRQGRGITPTPVALRLYEQVGELPRLAERAVGGVRAFDPSTARVTFRIALTDLGETIFLPALVPGLAAAAPRCSLEVVPLDIERAPMDLERGALDLAVASTPLAGLVCAVAVRHDRYCCVSRAGRFDELREHGGPTIEALAALPRVVVRGSTGHTLVEAAMPEPVAGSVFVPGFAAIPAILAASDLVAFVPHEITADWAIGRELEVLPLPRAEFSAPVRAHAASTPPAASTAWFADWAIEIMRALPARSPGAHEGAPD